MGGPTMCTALAGSLAPHMGHPPHACSANRKGWARQGKRQAGQRLQSSLRMRLPGVARVVEVLSSRCFRFEQKCGYIKHQASHFAAPLVCSLLQPIGMLSSYRWRSRMVWFRGMLHTPPPSLAPGLCTRGRLTWTRGGLCACTTALWWDGIVVGRHCLRTAPTSTTGRVWGGAVYLNTHTHNRTIEASNTRSVRVVLFPH